MENRREDEKQQKDVIELCHCLISFLQGEECETYIKPELQKAFPNYISVLQKRIKDLAKSDHGIVIAGETCSGKSTLINAILEKDIFKGKNRPSTSTICKIRNCGKTRIIIEYTSGDKSTIEHQFDLETKEGRKQLRDNLDTVTSKSSSSEGKNIRSVDLGFPIPFLKGNTILVDTPGIGGSTDDTEKLMDYLPHAVSFVFVIDASNAGGMLSDRLPVILSSLIDLMIKDEMPCFDPQDVIFLTNKWNNVTTVSYEDNYDSEDEATVTWTSLKDEIKESWSEVKEENIFKIDLKDVKKGETNLSTAKFKEFRDVLQTTIRKAHNRRAVLHLSFVREILDHLAGMINEMYNWNKLTEDARKVLAEEKEDTLRALRGKYEEISGTLENMTTELETEIANTVWQTMSTDDGKKSILNPEGRTPILKFKYWTKESFTKEIKSRMFKYVKGVMQREDIVAKNQEIQNKAISFYKQTCAELDENEKTDALSCKKEVYTEISAESERNLLILAVPITFAAFASLGVGVVLTGICVWIFWNSDSTRKEIIDTTYDSCKKKIFENLKKDSCHVLKEVVNKVMKDRLIRRLDSYEERVRKLREDHRNALDEQGLLLRLDKEVKSLTERLIKLQGCLNLGVLSTEGN